MLWVFQRIYQIWQMRIFTWTSYMYTSIWNWQKKNSSAGYSSDRKSVIELMFKYNLIQNALQISLLPRWSLGKPRIAIISFCIDLRRQCTCFWILIWVFLVQYHKYRKTFIYYLQLETSIQHSRSRGSKLFVVKLWSFQIIPQGFCT